MGVNSVASAAQKRRCQRRLRRNPERGAALRGRRVCELSPSMVKRQPSHCRRKRQPRIEARKLLPSRTGYPFTESATALPQILRAGERFQRLQNRLTTVPRSRLLEARLHSEDSRADSHKEGHLLSAPFTEVQPPALGRTALGHYSRARRALKRVRR